ncbi:MAG: CCA tRNA nucleotidyltransferase [Oscillospiraceae bacterium]|nr:CCA tRNA nucleotidyltransferase [Oscillospiraceae bacterium]
MNLPSYVKTAIEYLNKAGFEAYAVGGCVRDSLLLKNPDDWDLCTSAEPMEICEVFKGFHVIETGLKHGTVTVRIEHNSIEITTFRTDGEYVDHRRPEKVLFVKNLKEDLSRRDFTINALCYNENCGIVDLFNGKNDLENKIIRCVGNAEKRFEEDALRILRALRFSSCLGFEIEEETSKAIFNKMHLLKEISGERIRVELLKMLCGKGVENVLLKYRDVLAVIIPEIKATFDFKQNNPHHCYDVYTHIVKAVSQVKGDGNIKMVMLLHDIGKPETVSVDEKGLHHFKKHPTVSCEMARGILNRLKFDNKSKDKILNHIFEHDNRFPAVRKSVRKFVAKYDYDFFFEHLEIRLADTLAQSEYNRDGKLYDISEKKRIANELIAENAQLSMKNLAIDGSVLMGEGYPEGKILGEILKDCFEAVVEEKVSNDKTELLKYVFEKYRL